MTQNSSSLRGKISYGDWQLAVFPAVFAALLIAAFFQRRRRSIALTVWGIFLLDVGCLFLIKAVYPEWIG